MGKIRQDEKATNEETIKDSAEAQTAVAQALTVLKEFYAKAGDATALLQQPAPEIFDAPYKGMQSENGGVVGMLEVIESDFARLEAETRAAEATAQKEHLEGTQKELDAALAYFDKLKPSCVDAGVSY